MPEPISTLDKLFAPISLADFFANFWGRTHLRVSRGDPSYYSDLFSYADIDRFLRLVRRHKDEILTLCGAGSTRRSSRSGDCVAHHLRLAQASVPGRSALGRRVRLWLASFAEPA